MSLRALTWALEHADCPSPAAKLVLIVFANYVSARGDAFPSTTRIAAMTKLDIKTVRSAIDALEDCELIFDTGERKGRTAQVKVYRLRLESHPETDAFDEEEAPRTPVAPRRAHRSAPAESHPKADGLKAPVFPAKGTRKREAEPVTGTGTPNAPDGALPPSGGRARARKRIDEGWAPPAIAELPEHARAIAAQWSAGAYAAQAEGFRADAIGAGRRGADWNEAWIAHVVRIGARPLRDARAGLTHAAPTPAAVSSPAAVPSIRKPSESPQLARWRAAVLAAIGAAAYQRWIDPLEGHVVGDELELTAPTSLIASYAESEHGVALARAADAELGGARVRVTARRAAA